MTFSTKSGYKGRFTMFRVIQGIPYFSISSAHFVVGEGYSEAIHGHNFGIDVEIFGEQNTEFMVVDFFQLRPIVEDILAEWDHRTLIPGANPNIALEENGDDLWIRFDGKEYSLPLEDICILPTPNITVEELARLLTHRLAKKFTNSNIKRIQCSVFEYIGQGASFNLEIGSSNKPL